MTTVRINVVNARVLSAQLEQAGPAVVRAVERALTTGGQLLKTRIQAHASGRPGPNAPTGDYRRSWSLRKGREGGNLVVEVGTNAPQGRRLEMGFYGVDALGRHYSQSSFPHVGPAFNETEPSVIAAISREVDQVL